MDGEEEKGRKERGDGQDVLESKAPGRISEGERRKEPKIISDGKHRILKIGTESRGNHSLCSGLELHHPIMSKLWNLGGQTSRQDMPLQ